VSAKFGAVPVRFVLNTAALDALLKDRGGFVNQEIHGLADEVRLRVQMRCPEGTRTRRSSAASPEDFPGQLRESIYVVAKRGLGYNVGSHLPYAKRQQWHNRTRPQFLTGGLADVVGAHAIRGFGHAVDE